MKIGAIVLLLTLSANGEEPKIVFDNRPETGSPPEARDQKPDPKISISAPPNFHALTSGTIRIVRIRYFDKEAWATEEDAGAYVAGFLSNKSSKAYGAQIWAQSVGIPDIECIVEFTDEVSLEGRLLIWGTVGCYRDTTGRWWYVTLYDHYHQLHPKGNRSHAMPPKIE